MSAQILVLGGGTGGTLTANRLRKVLPADATITVVDEDDRHVYQPGLLFVPFGLAHAEDIVRPRARQLHRGIDYHQSAIDSVDLEANTVRLADGTALPYDVLIVATGARLVSEETEGLTGKGWLEKVFTFYDLVGAAALEAKLATFEGGRLVVNVVDMPIKCPVAPLEFCFLADWYFHERGNRDRVDITYVTPLDGAFTKPTASRALGGMLEERGIELVTEFNTGEVDGEGGRLVAYDGREVPFDLAVVVPVHSGAAYVGNSPGLGDELDFVPADEHTLQSKAKPNVFVIGDAASLPVSKAGSVTHFEGEVLVENVQRFLRGEVLDASYDGHANCFIETGFHKAMLIDFNYEQEPVGGHYPVGVGLSLLKESRLNHLGKLMFQWFYWHALLPGRDIPGITPDMPVAGSAWPARRRDPTDSKPREVRCGDADRNVRRRRRRLNDEGFFEHPEQWTEAMAAELARTEGIDSMTDDHWKVVRFMRQEYLEKGTGPTVRVLGKQSGVSVKELYELFPKGPAKTAARIAGIPKPRGCV